MLGVPSRDLLQLHWGFGVLCVLCWDLYQLNWSPFIISLCSMPCWIIFQHDWGFCMLGVPSRDIQQFCRGLSVQRVALLSRIVRRHWSLI